MRIRELWIKNFKSLRDVKLELKPFNLIVGPNGSGKTNLIEALEFFRDAFAADGVPRPWRKWWRPENVVWMRDETLPLFFGLSIEFAGFETGYELTCSVTGGEFRIERETLWIEGWGRLDRTKRGVRVEYEEEFLEKMGERSLLPGAESEHKLPIDRSILHFISPTVTGALKLVSSLEQAEQATGVALVKYFVPTSRLSVLAPVVRGDALLKEFEKARLLRKGIVPRHYLGAERFVSLPYVLARLFTYVIENVIVLRQLNYYELERPQEYSKTKILESDGRNLYTVLYNLFLSQGRLPDRIASVLSGVMEGYDLRFDLTADGRVYVKLDRGDLQLPPPCAPDGVHKLLAVLTALELEPSILAIDELEDSLHPRWVELVIDLLKSSGSVVIATTHSPAVVDLVEPEDLVLAELEEGATVFKRIAEPEKVREELREHGITLSERWLWGLPE